MYREFLSYLLYFGRNSPIFYRKWPISPFFRTFNVITNFWATLVRAAVFACTPNITWHPPGCMAAVDTTCRARMRSISDRKWPILPFLRTFRVVTNLWPTLLRAVVFAWTPDVTWHPPGCTAAVDTICRAHIRSIFWPKMTDFAIFTHILCNN